MTPESNPTVEVLDIPLLNGGFESGRGEGWTEYSQLSNPIILSHEDIPTISAGVTPHGGSWLAWLAGDDLEISYLRQNVTILRQSALLTYWYWIDSDETCNGLDTYSVMVNADQLKYGDLCSDNDTDGWVLNTIDLSAYIGQTVTLRIQAQTDDYVTSSLFIDDVSLGGYSGDLFLPLVAR
jgi:hypothetical protein